MKTILFFIADIISFYFICPSEYRFNNIWFLLQMILYIIFLIIFLCTEKRSEENIPAFKINKVIINFIKVFNTKIIIRRIKIYIIAIEFDFILIIRWIETFIYNVTRNATFKKFNLLSNTRKIKGIFTRNTLDIIKFDIRHEDTLLIKHQSST